jgi:hypothetical protein
MVFWVVVLCSVDTSTLRMEAAQSCKMLVSSHHTTWHNNSDHEFFLCYCENLRSNKVSVTLQYVEIHKKFLLLQDGFTPVDRIKQGMKVEVQDKMDPHQLWVATVSFSLLFYVMSFFRLQLIPRLKEKAFISLHHLLSLLCALKVLFIATNRDYNTIQF